MVLVVVIDNEDDVCCVVACGGTRTEFSDGLITNSGMECLTNQSPMRIIMRQVLIMRNLGPCMTMHDVM